MDDPQKLQPHTSEIKNVLPDVVHTEQIPAIGAVVGDETGLSEIDIVEPSGDNAGTHDDQDNSQTESISEHIPSKMDTSITESDNIAKQESQNLHKIDADKEKVPKHSSLNIPFPHSPASDNPSTQETSKQSTSWPLDVNAISDMHLISEESPVNLALSSDLSKDIATHENKSHSIQTPKSSEDETPKESPRSDDYLDSLNEEYSHNSNISVDENSSQKSSHSENVESLEKGSSGSEEIIKLDIRGHGAPKYPLSTAKIIFGPPPEGSTVIDPNIEQIPVFQNLLSPFLVGAGDGAKVEEVFDDNVPVSKDPTPEKSVTPEQDSLSSNKIEQSDLLVEEITVDYDTKEKDNEKEEVSLPTQPKSLAPEDASFSTITEYKTICEEYHVKLVHLEDAITQRDQLIEELTVSLQRSILERDDLRTENDHLINEVQALQHAVGERSHSEHDTIKAQLSDFVKYQTMMKDDSTKFYSALMSGGSSMQSSNGEKDMDHEEITVNYSKSDLKSSSDEFQTGFESKLTIILNKLDASMEENLRNKLRESVIQILCEEIGKMRLEYDTELKELEGQLQQDKQAYTVETRRLRELLATVKSGNADIDMLRQELSVKHEKEMENLRTYFEKKCSDMERSYSEEVWRGRVCLSPGGSASSLDALDAAGDYARRRTRSAELPSLTLESTQLEPLLKQSNKKLEQQLEELRAEHAAHIADMETSHREAIAALEEQITQLKAHIQTSENTEANVSLYQQDIDLELEKDARFESRLDEVRREVVQQLQEQIQVLLSDPDAEVSSWPLELVALRDKIQGDKAKDEKELSSLRDELSGGEDKWRQRRNLSFDQNRHLEEVTKERDGLKRVAVSLHRVVGQLVAYCAHAEDELNRTVLTQLLGRLLPDEANETLAEDESRPATPNLSADLNLSALARNSKHVHFAPDLNSILTDLDEDAVLSFLQHQRDLSVDIKRELEHSLKRLRNEAHELLDLSARLATKGRHDSKMLESSQVQITELVQDLDSKQKNCDNCELHKKTMEEAMSECIQREGLLRSELDAAMLKIAQFVTGTERMHSTDVIAEGYGTGPRALGGGWRGAGAEGGALSLDGAGSPRGHLAALQHDLDALHRDRDDLHQQVKRMTDSPVHKICCEKLEAANRQLRSTRQFVEEQAAEREAERDEFAKRLAELREENARLATRLQTNARILNEMHELRQSHCTARCRKRQAYVEQLEAQTREMNQLITDLETKKASADEELKSTEEKVTLLRDIIANLEAQLEQKTVHEGEILEQLEEMRKTIDERDGKMRAVLGELESLRSERVEQSDVSCLKCGQEEDKYTELLEKVKEQCVWLERKIDSGTQRLERLHEVCSASCSEPSEDVSLREHKNTHIHVPSGVDVSPRDEADEGQGPSLVQLAGVWESLQAHARAEQAALKRVHDLEMQRAQLKDVAQEVRAERDVLQTRMSEQALKISSLSARLQQQRNDAEALAHDAASKLSVQLHDALAEVQRLKEELESKDKQLVRVKQNLEERDKLNEQHHSLYGNSCNPKDKVIILERELSSAQSRIGQLESLTRSLESDKEQLHASLRDLQRALAEKEDQLQELLALKLDDDHKEKSEVEAKASARTLSDIVSISEFDEQDLMMRRAEMAHNMSLSGAPYAVDNRDKTQLNRTLPPDLQRPQMSSLNIEPEHLDQTSPRADSLPAHLTSTQNKDAQTYKRNMNETTMFGTIDRFGDSIKHSTAQNIPDNCSMFPNRDASGDKNVSVEPKKIDFSLEVSADNKTQEDQEFTSLRELGITLDIKQENFPDILTQLKHEIKKSRTELETCKTALNTAEEQVREFPALIKEVDELKTLLESTVSTMEKDKKFYESQLENFTSSKKLLDQRLSELTQEVNDKAKDLHLLKEDILRRENMILELAKEKRNLTNKMTELEVRIDELQSRNAVLEKFESENHQMKEKLSELNKLEQLVSEKNQQIDSLNQHLDRLDDLQRNLNDKTEELDNLKEAFEEKSNEAFQLQDTLDALNRDMSKINEENNLLNTCNKELKLKLTKMEKEQENASLKLQNSETELERLNSMNNELTSKLEELKILTDKLKDKETELEILQEDMSSYHEEIASLKEQLKLASRSPSPRSKAGEARQTDRHASADKRHLVKIRKQVSLLQHELDFNKKELNDKAFELARAKLDVTELKNSLSQANKLVSDKDLGNQELRQQSEALQLEIQHLTADRRHMHEQMEILVARMREECNVSELKSKLREKVERCQELECELRDMKELVERVRESPSRSASAAARSRALVVSGARSLARGRATPRRRSPTAELEQALRDQLHYSHELDDDIMEQILSASSDEREDIPRLALHTSKSSSSIHSSTSERMSRLRCDNEKLQLQLSNLQSRLQDKDALITELNRVRDKLSEEWQTAKLRYEAERDNSARLQLLLDTYKETADTLQNQDSNMIQMLKKRLESAMQSELELQQREQQHKARLTHLERQLLADAGHGDSARLQHELEEIERLKGEVSLLKCKLEAERARVSELQSQHEQARQHAQRELAARADHAAGLRQELADLRRLKHEAGIELVRARELLNIQSATIAELEKKLAINQRPINDALTEIECHKSELAREISNLKKCLVDKSPELISVKQQRDQLQVQVQQLQQQLQVDLQARPQQDDKDQAIRYLHGRCLRLESWRKALVWQKRYLQRVVAGYAHYERSLPLTNTRTHNTHTELRGKKRFKCVVSAVIVVVRLGFLVRRRAAAARLAAASLLPHRTQHTNNTPTSQYASNSPPSRDRPTPAADAAKSRTDTERGSSRHDSLSRRLLKHELWLNLPASPAMELTRRSPYSAGPQHDEPFILSSPRGEVAAAYLNKLELVSRRLNHAVETNELP